MHLGCDAKSRGCQSSAEPLDDLAQVDVDGRTDSASSLAMRPHSVCARVPLLAGKWMHGEPIGHRGARPVDTVGGRCCNTDPVNTHELDYATDVLWALVAGDLVAGELPGRSPSCRI